MFGSISENSAVRTVSQTRTIDAGNSAHRVPASARFEVAETASAKPAGVATGPEENHPGHAALQNGENELNPGEVRKSEVTEGELKTKVYDQSGKLLRVIPPGYLPVGEKKFDITI